jgi:uncharacterized protein YdhG (YjbR/CyaY superfamily)
MSDKERLQQIKNRINGLIGFEEAPDNAMYYMRKDQIVWLVSQADKTEQLQQENERLKKFLNWEQEEAQGLDEEVTFQLEQLKRAQEEIERLEKRYEFASQIEYELRQEIQQLQQQLQQAQTKLNSIRFYVENPVPDDKLTEIILNIINDPNHEGI